MFILRKLLMIVVISLLTYVPVLAQNSELPINESAADLIYSVSRTPERIFDTARSVEVITREDIWRLNARTLPEVLMEEAGVFVQQTNYGGGSPIIRGLMGKEILILIDGVKINNTTYRYGPIQYLATIDLNMIDRIEIVRGIESVLTSYALGGVINIITKKGTPDNQQKSVNGELFSRYSSADKGFTGHGEVYGNTPSFRYHGGITYRDCDDVIGGGDIDTQEGTGYDEMAGNINFDYYLTSDQLLSFQYMLLEQNEVPRTDRIANGQNIEFDFDPQRFQLMKLAYQDFTAREWAQSITFNLFWHRQDENRQEIRSSALDTRRMYTDYDILTGFNVEMSSFFGETNRLLYGMDFSTEEILSRRRDVNLETGEIKDKRGQFTDGATYQSFALFLQHHFNPWIWLDLTTGLRYNYYSVGGEEDSSVGELDLDNSGADFTGSINTVYHASETLNVILNVNRGFRSPNVDDISIYDEREEGIEVPNPDVESVKIITTEGGVKYLHRYFTTSIFYFYSWLTDMHERAGGTFKGMTFFDDNGNGIQDEGELDVLQRQNIGEATINGIELDFSIHPHPNFSINGDYIWTKGEDTYNDTDLSRIPPGYGFISFRWSGSGALQPWAEFVYHFAGDQRDISPRDASDDRIGPDGTDGFNIFNVRGGLSISKNIRLIVALENISDEEYKYHSSGVYRPGFQIVGGVEFKI